MKRKLNIAIFFTIFSLCYAYSHTCYGHNIMDMVTCHIYEEEGAFVVKPAKIGGITGLLISLPPAFIITAPFIFFSDKYHQLTIRYIISGTGKTISFLFGAPPYVMKKVFWDVPIYLWNSIIKNEKNSNESVELTEKPLRGFQ